MRSRAVLVAKIAATLALLAFALSRLDLAALGVSLAQVGPGAIAVLVVLTVVQIGLSAYRWHRVLAYVGERVPVLALVGDTLVGTTYNMFLPTTVGGDVVRALRCAGRVRAPHLAWAAVAYERIMGLVCLALLPLAGLALGAGHGRPALLAVAAASAALFLGVLAFAHAPLRLVARLAAARAPALAGVSGRLADAFTGPLSGPAVRLETFGWSLAYQLVALSMLVAAGAREPGIVRAAYIGAPLVLILAMLPVTIAGLGLRESLFVAILPEFGPSPAHAGTLAVVWLAANLGCALAGAALLVREGGARPEEAS